MNSGSPFYTTSQNPMDYLNTACLEDMKSESCNVTWSVNATGAVDLTYEFFAIANSTSYPSLITQSSSGIVNITIKGNSPPTHSTPILNSTSPLNTTSANLTVYNQSTSDADAEPVKNIINWKLNATSFEKLIMPFEGGSSSSSTSDYSTYSNTGTVTGATWSSSLGYDGLGAYTFDSSSSDYIAIATDQSLNFSQSCAFTQMAWIQPNHSDTSWHGFLGHQGAGGSTRMPSMWIYDNTEIHAGFGDGTAWRSFTTTTDPITENTWNHVAAVFDGTNYKIFVNGVEEYSQTGSWTGQCPNPSYAQLDIGRVDNYFNGTIDDVRVYSRDLSAQQIAAIYANKTNLIVSQELSAGETWQACITPNDGTEDGSTLCSNNLTISSDNPPVISDISPVNASNTTNPVTLSLTTDINADCEFSTTETFVYGTGIPFSVGQGSTTHSTSLGVLVKATYSYYIKCENALGTTNTDSDQGATTFNVIGEAPTHSNPILNSIFGTNYTSENLTCYNQSTADTDGDSVKNIINWKLNGTSFEKLIMPFEGSSTSSSTKDYSSYSNTGTVSGAT